VLTSDQGFYLGDHGFFDKRFIYEESLRMPFIVQYPNKVKAGSVNEDIIRNVDFAPTLLELAGIETAQKMHGTSFAANLEGKTADNWQDAMYYHYYEFPFWHHVQPHYGIRTEKFTLAHFYYNIDVWELYDLEKDPEQMHNIIGDPAYKNTISALKVKLYSLMDAVGNKKDLAEIRKITDTDFGLIVDKHDDETSVQDLLTK